MNSTYLQRRLSLLINKFEEGKSFFSEDLLRKGDGSKLIEELSLLKKLPDGSVDISSATPLVRSVARIFYTVEKHFRSGSDTKADETIYQPEEDLTIEDTMKSQREYFDLLERFFQEATGTTAEKFLEKGESYDGAIQRRRNDRFVKCFGDALDNYLPKIEAFHSKTSDTLLRTHQSVGGLKCVIGGSSRFPETAFDGFRKFALYADTIFIPDPILSWI